MNNLLEWYRNTKFGLFIHWGPYSSGGIEASWSIMAPGMSEAMFRVPSNISEKEYTALPAKFNPVDFNPDEWVQSAVDAGMKYIVFTSKHHDGFCMFDAPGTDYKITTTPYGKDICLELAEACRRAGMPLGFYYSPPDMNHYGYRNTSKPMTKNWTGEPKRKEWNEYLDYMESHIRKLLTDYGHVSILWFDGLSNHGKYDPQRFHKLIRDLSPETLINDRLGEGYDFVTPEQFIPKTGIPTRTPNMLPGMDPGGDRFLNLINLFFKLPIIKGFIRKQMKKYSNGELELSPIYQEAYPSPERFQPWETCMTLGNSWAYNPLETEWKEPKQIIKNIIFTAAKGGNYLLNIGPTGIGTFPVQAVEILKEIGQWMTEYGDCIYGSTYSPLQQQDWGALVRKGEKVYLFIIKHPHKAKLVVNDFPGEVKSVCVFSGKQLSFRKVSNFLEIDLPEESTDSGIQVLEADISGSISFWEQYSEPVDTGKKQSK
jgi:alpha-L-fucosidase